MPHQVNGSRFCEKESTDSNDGKTHPSHEKAYLPMALVGIGLEVAEKQSNCIYRCSEKDLCSHSLS